MWRAASGARANSAAAVVSGDGKGSGVATAVGDEVLLSVDAVACRKLEDGDGDGDIDDDDRVVNSTSGFSDCLSMAANGWLDASAAAPGNASLMCCCA